VAEQAEPTQPEPLPTGTVTFLFSDIEGSTERWERERSAMQSAVQRHDAILREAISAHAGHVFKTVGDAFCAVFTRPEDAVASALDAQRAIDAEDFSQVGGLSVRIALHTGTSDERDGDYFGPTVNRVARLIAIGHGGQVLVSGITTELVQGTLPSQATLQDLGPHRLKDLTLPEQVYQLLAPGLRKEFPSLRSLGSLPNNLPLQLTSFVGRDREVAEIEALLKKHRVVTLVGSGGVGKTRTSLQVGANLLDGFGDGVWFVELAPIVDENLVPSAVAEVLGLDVSGKSDPLSALVASLRSKHLLLIMDNCEHLVAAAARVADAIVRGCPKARILASSRQGLGIAGEATFRMPSLAVPEPGAYAVVADAARYGAVELFVERAQAVDPHFALTDENAAAIGEICRRLDGIALAIELAAARVRMLSPQQLQRRLDERFRILTGGSRTALPRQQTLRALVDWSFDLLGDRERTVFRRTSVFVDGFTLEAANEVCSDQTIDEFEIFDTLSSLVDKSLVIADLVGAATRYRLLESTRAYAVERLAEAHERERLSERHLTYYEKLAQRGLAAYNALQDRGFDTVELHLEMENVRAALGWSLAGGDVHTGASLASALAPYGRIFTAEWIGWTDRCLAVLDPAETRLRAELKIRLGELLGNAGRTVRSEQEFDEVVALCRTANMVPSLIAALMGQSFLYLRLDRVDDLMRTIAEVESLAPADPLPRFRFKLLRHKARAAGYRGDFDAAVGLYRDIQALAREFGNDGAMLHALHTQAEFEHARGETARAIALITESLPRFRLLGREIGTVVLANLAAYHVALDQLDRAAAVGTEAVVTLERLAPDGVLVTIAIEHLALVLAISGDLVTAARIAGYTDANIERLGAAREYTEKFTRTRLVRVLDDLPAGELASLTAEGEGLTTGAAIAETLEAIRAFQRSRAAFEEAHSGAGESAGSSS
jgi:predicted ATPase/class 3 adenylate cyclase